jgi:hypothetical protein
LGGSPHAQLAIYKNTMAYKTGLINFQFYLGQLTVFGGFGALGAGNSVEALNGTAWHEVDKLKIERAQHAMVLLLCEG